MKVLKHKKAGKYVLELIEEEHPWDVEHSKGSLGRKIFAPSRDTNRIVYKVKITNTAKSSSWMEKMTEVGDVERRFGNLDRAMKYFDANYQSLSKQGRAPLGEGRIMKISKRQLRRIVKEEKSKLIKEQWGQSIETGSDLIEFAKAYAGLGGAVQDQFDALASGWIQDGAHEPTWSELVYEQNPNAIQMAADRLTGLLRQLSRAGNEDAGYLLDMLEDAQEVYAKGDAEVEADQMAAEGMDEGEY